MTIQRNSNHILDLNRILKRKPHTFSTGDEIQVPPNTQKTYNVDTSNNFSVNTLDSNGLIKSTKAGGQNDALKNLADKNQPVPTSDGYFGQDGAYNKGKNVAGAISAVAGGLTGMYAGYKGNSTIADTSGVKKQANSIASNSSNAESNDALLNDMNSFNAMNNVSYGQVRGASNGDMAKNTLNSVVSGASAGSVAGPWGAAIGAVVGLGTGVAGIFSGNSKAKREKRRLNGQIAAANQSAINNFANTASNINTNTNINLGRNYFAQGGHLFAGGGKNDKYIDSNERYLMDYAQSKAYRNRLSKYTSDPNILNYAPNSTVKWKPTPNKFAEGGHIFKNGGKANKTSKSKKAKHVVLQTDYTKPVIDNYGRVFYPFSSGVVVDDKSSGLKPEIGKSGFVEHDVNQTLSGIQFDKNGNVVKNTYKESPSVNDDTRIPITSSPSVLPNGERREEPYEPTDEQQYYRHETNGDDVDFQERSMAAGLALAGIPFGGWTAAALNVPQALYTWKHRDETGGVNKFLDYASVIPGMKFTKALNLSTNPAIIRSARLAAWVTKKAHLSDIAIRSKQFAAPVAALQMVHKAGDAQNVLTYPSLVKDWFNRQLIDTRFDNYLDSPVKPLILNKFADGGDIDEKKAVETPGQWERRYVNSPEFEKRYKSILYHGADVPSLQDIRDQVNNTHYLHVNFGNGMGSRQMVPLNVRTNVADTYDYGLRHKNEFELSHYVKPAGKGNPWIVEDTRPYPATADFTKDNVMPHEHGHVIDFNNYLSTAEYNDDGSTQPDPKYMFDANRKPIDKANSSISYSHDSKEAENYADINALKYNLYKFGIKDIANGDIVTIDDIRKFKDIINKMPVKQRNAYNRIFYLFDDDAIVRFLNKLADSNNHPDVNVPSVNVFAEGGDLDYDAIKQSYNDSNTGYSKFNHSSGWIKDYMRDHMKTGLVADGSVDAATMKGIKKANMNMNMFYTANGTDGEEMSNNVDYGWVKKNNPSQLYQYENQNLPTNGDKVQQSNLGSSTSSKAAKKAAPINVSKSKFYANIQQETKANPQLNETMSIAYNYLIKKGFKPVNASAIVGCIYAESRMNPQQDNGDHCGLLQWTKFKTENNKKKFGDRYNKLIEHTKQLEGDKYKDGDENLLLNQLAFISDDLRSKDFNNDKVKLIHTLSKSKSIYDSAKAIMEIYGGDDKDKYSPTERAAYALYCLKNISTMKQDNNKDKK